MKTYLCENVELVNDGVKNPYLRLTFSDQTNANSTNVFAKALQKKVIIVLSGGFFNADRTPDKAKNLLWCQQMQPQFTNQLAQMEDFTVKVEPYYRINSDKSVNTSVLYDTIVITTFASQNGEEIVPLLGWGNVESQAKNRLANGVEMYITKRQYDAEQIVKQQIAQTQPQTQPQQNGFAGLNPQNGSGLPF